MKIILRAAIVGFLIALIVPAGAVSPPTPSQKHPCHDDAFRFCREDIPDHAKIHACLIRHVEQLSPACRDIIGHR